MQDSWVQGWKLWSSFRWSGLPTTRQYSSLSPKDNKRMKEAILAYENKTISDASLENRINGVIKLLDPEDELSEARVNHVQHH